MAFMCTVESQANLRLPLRPYERKWEPSSACLFRGRVGKLQARDKGSWKTGFSLGATNVISFKATVRLICDALDPKCIFCSFCATLITSLVFLPSYDNFPLTMSYFPPTNCRYVAVLLNKLSWHEM